MILVDVDGSNNNKIRGEGNLTIDGTITNTTGKTIEQNRIIINEDKRFTANASDITTVKGIVNVGTMTFTGGRNENEISGDNGRLEITGDVENEAGVTQKEVEIRGTLTNKEGKTITATVVTNKANAEIANRGAVNATNITNECRDSK